MSYKVLIADDEFLIRWSLKQALSQEGYDITLVANGQEAIEAGQNTHFDFVITDLFMPEVDGWKVLNFFSQKQPPSRVIVTTGHSADDLERIANERGAWAYVEKPYILTKIRSMLIHSTPPPGPGFDPET